MSVDNSGYYGLTNSTINDENGFYQLDLSSEFKYIARVFGYNSMPSDTIFNPANYTPVYYNQVTNPNDATVIIMDREYNDINYTIGSKKEFDNSIIGNLKDEGGAALNTGFVIACLVDPEYDYFREIYFVKIVNGSTALTTPIIIAR
jgi:hypothetical protein